jgi:aerobic-type carbon monoxide dehydrogenase small subunit (CoxS/CutS family)
MSKLVFWQGQPVPFEQGETLAAALQRSGIKDLGPSGASLRSRIFCGIGTCQACIVAMDDGTPVEACLTLATDGMKIGPVLAEVRRG